jgi:hypothetical protein
LANIYQNTLSAIIYHLLIKAILVEEMMEKIHRCQDSQAQWEGVTSDKIIREVIFSAIDNLCINSSFP